MKKNALDININKIKKISTPYLLLSPILILAILIIVYPLVSAFILSLNEVSLINPRDTNYIGFDNYIRVLRDYRFFNSIKKTVYFVFFAAILQTFFGYAIGLLLSNIEERFRKIYMGAILVSLMIPPIISAAIWRLVLFPDVGIFNYFIRLFGLTPRAWLAEASLALPSIVLIEVWRGSPITIILFLATFLSFPSDVLEAATVDGASYIQKLRYMIIPITKPIILIVFLLRLIEKSKTFDIIWGLTEGGPGGATQVLSILAYMRTFVYYELGYGAAIGYMILILAFIFGAIYINTIRLGD